MPNYSENAVLLADTQFEKISNRKYIDSGEQPSDNDTWFHGTQQLPRASSLSLGKVHGVLPFDGIRNPSSRSNTSQKVLIPYRVPANNWVPKVGKAESWGEAAASLEAIMSSKVYDVAFQPCKVEFRDEDGVKREYTHDLLVTFRNGHKRLIFVRNEESLTKQLTQHNISAIAAATPEDLTDDMIVVNANDYSRQRRENLLRMHHFVFHSDAEADEAVLDTTRRLKSFYYMKDLFPHAPVRQPRAFAACYRLVARGVLHANLDQVLWENSHIEVAA